MCKKRRQVIRSERCQNEATNCKKLDSRLDVGLRSYPFSDIYLALGQSICSKFSAMWKFST